MVDDAPLGVIETLTEGFATLNKRLWLFLIPVVLDLFLAFGPGISAAPLTDTVVTWFQSVPSTGDPQADQELLTNKDSIATTLRDTNFVTLTAWQLSSLVAATSAGDLQGRQTIQVSSFGELSLLVLGVMTIGLLMASFYLGGIAGALRDEPLSSAYVTKSMVGWLRYMLLFALMIAVLFPLSLTMLVMAQLVGLVAAGVGVFIGTVFISVCLAAGFYMTFAKDAIFVAEVNPIRAIWYSFQVVRRSFWQAVLLIVLITVILFGLRIPLKAVVAQPVGLIGAVGAYAYIATGLSIGTMLFFRQRLLKWQAEPNNPQLTSV